MLVSGISVTGVSAGEHRVTGMITARRAVIGVKIQTRTTGDASMNLLDQSVTAGGSLASTRKMVTPTLGRR